MKNLRGSEYFPYPLYISILSHTYILLTHTCISILTHTYILHSHTYILLTHTYIYSFTYMHFYSHTHTYILLTHTYICTLTHIYSPYTYIHFYSHTHTYILLSHTYISTFFGIHYFPFKQEVTLRPGNTCARLAQLFLTILQWCYSKSFSFLFKYSFYFWE